MQKRNMPHAIEILLAAKRVKENFIDTGIGTPADREFCEAVDTVVEFVIEVTKIAMGGRNNASND